VVRETVEVGSRSHYRRVTVNYSDSDIIPLVRVRWRVVGTVTKRRRRRWRWVVRVVVHSRSRQRRKRRWRWVVRVVVRSRSRRRLHRRDTKQDTVNSVDIASNTDAAAAVNTDTRGAAPLLEKEDFRHCFRRANTPPVHPDYTLDTRDEDSRGASLSWSSSWKGDNTGPDTSSSSLLSSSRRSVMQRRHRGTLR